MTKWQVQKLGTVCAQVLTGGTPLTSNPEYFENGKIPWLKTKEVNFCRITNTEYFITAQGLADSSAKLVPANSVIVAMYGQGDTAGRVAINKIPLATNQACCNLVLDATVADYQFIYYFLKNSYVELVQIKTGSAQPNLNTKLIKDFDILLPPLPEQEAITAVLSSLDDKIDLLHRQNKTLEALAQTLFRHWFIDSANDDWEEFKLESFIEVMRGLSYKGVGLTEAGDGIPMHNLNSVYEGGGYKYEGIKYYNGPYQERHKVFPGDIIITNTEQGHNLLLIGYPAVVPRFFGQESIFSQHIYRLRIFDSRITNQFLYYLLMSYDVREQITGATNGSTVNMLSKDGIEWATFKLPPQNLITQFSQIIQPFWDKKEANYIQIRTLEKLRDTLLPKLMSGEVRVRL